MSNHNKTLSVAPTLAVSTCASYAKTHLMTGRHWHTTKTRITTSSIFAHNATVTSRTRKNYRTTKTMHKPTVADIDGPGKMIYKVIQTNTGGVLGAATRTSPDTGLTPSSTEKGGAREKCTLKCKKNGHVSNSCPRPRPTGPPGSKPNS